MRSLRIVTLALACAAVSGCGVDIEAQPAPSCITDPQRCSAPIDGGAVRRLEAPRFSPNTGFTAYPGPGVGPVQLDGGEAGGDAAVATDCQFPLELCDGTCVDTNNDESNCGVCGLVCESGFSCVLGLCSP